jgi:hypothetical protein
VIATARSEPALSRGFTDRVLERLPTPAVAAKPRHARWAQVVYRFGTSSAAAAVIFLAVLLAWPKPISNTSDVELAGAPRPMVMGYQEYNPLYESLVAPLVDEARRNWHDTYAATTGLASAGQDVLYDANQVLLCTLSFDAVGCTDDEHGPTH